jgi:hypothetical protein
LRKNRWERRKSEETAKCWRADAQGPDVRARWPDVRAVGPDVRGLDPADELMNRRKIVENGTKFVRICGGKRGRKDGES